MSERRKKRSELLAEIEELRARLEEAEEVCRAIRNGEVDAIVTATAEGGEQIFTLKGAETLYRAIVESMGEGAGTLTDSGIVLYANTRLAAMLKTSLHKVIGASLYDCVREQDHGSLKELLAKGLGEPARAELQLLAAGGGRVPVSLAVSPLPINNEPGLSMVVADLTEQKRAEEALRTAYEEVEAQVEERVADLRAANNKLHWEVAERLRIEEELRESEERFRVLADSSPDSIWMTDAQGEIAFVNRVYLDFFGVPLEQVKTSGWQPLVHPDDAQEYVGAYFNALLGRAEFVAEARVRRADGEWRWIASRGAPRFSESGEFLGHVGSSLDITDRKRLEEELKHQAHHDALTGLPNRRLFTDMLTLEIAKARRSQGKAAVLFLDLDRFKYINDTLGHDIGDGLLRVAAERLRASVRESDVIARLGGDEFTVLLTDISHAEDIVPIARKIVESFRASFMIAGHALHISTSVGISLYPDDADGIEALFKNADIAMYHAKELGGNAYQFFDPAMNLRTIERMRLESWLRQAIVRGELEVYYQPQLNAETRQVVCAEALVRWRHPEQGMLDPQHFIPLAEETGFITAIDEWVLRTACAQVKRWEEAGLPPLCVTVNLSAKQFHKADLVERIAGILRETGIDAACLDIEVTESTAMKSLEHTIPSMTRLAAMGVGIAIDDFGTGYSSLNYLKKLPIHKLKIDQSFVRDIMRDSDDRTIVKAVTAMAQNMKLKVIAEGVETEEQAEFLKSIGCEEMQGFLFSRPLPADKFEALVADGR